MFAMMYIEWPNTEDVNALLERALQFPGSDFSVWVTLYILFAIRSLNVQTPENLEFFLGCLHLKESEMIPQDACSILEYLGQSRYYDQRLIEFIQESVIEGRWKLYRYAVIKLVYGFANFEDVVREDLVKALSQQFMKDKHRVFPREIILYLLGMTCLECPFEHLQLVVNLHINEVESSDIIEKSLTNLRNVQIATQSDQNELYCTPSIQEECIRARLEQSQHEAAQVSEFKGSVFDLVNKEFPESKVNVIDEGVLIDIGLEVGEDKKVGVLLVKEDEVMINDKNMVVVDVQIRRKMYKKLGWVIVEVSELDWKDMPEYKDKVVEMIRQCVAN
eukprot:TRINITY_DN1982_c0_g1_i1.p1 TRINITY_DN1982_c0_g1~~TRINITY_DN1982_c0_g1_i1.p1  ORF type:complete len:359 (-),score=41.00 TRINITY_DN1982_c0_g1_i1:412-1410(-)